MRYILAVTTLIIGYILGSVLGFRAGVTDYVENDARRIRAVANSMYDKKEDLPEHLQKQVEQQQKAAEEEEEEEDDSTERSRTFQ